MVLATDFGNSIICYYVIQTNEAGIESVGVFAHRMKRPKDIMF